MSKAGLTRKKIKVRSKSGKTFQRSVMVRAEAIGKRTSGKKLNSLNPWETHHVQHVSTNTKLGERQKAYGSAGPGSDHSAVASIIGSMRQRFAYRADYVSPPGDGNVHGMNPAFTRLHAAERRATSLHIAQSVFARPVAAGAEATALSPVGARNRQMLIDGLNARYDRANIHEVHQDPRKWVR